MSDIYKEFGVDVLRDCCSENEGPTAAEMKMAREIERLRAENIHLRRAGMDRPSAELHEAALAAGGFHPRSCEWKQCSSAH